MKKFISTSSTKKTGNLIQYRKVDSDTGREVDREDIIRGYEKSKGEYIPVEPEELEAVAIESKRAIEIDQFVDRKEIDELYFGNPYYIAPDGEAGMRSDLALCRSRASVW